MQRADVGAGAAGRSQQRGFGRLLLGAAALCFGEEEADLSPLWEINYFAVFVFRCANP